MSTALLNDRIPALELAAAVVRGDSSEWPAQSGGLSESDFVDAAVEHSIEALIVWRLRGAGTFGTWPVAIRERLERIVRDEVLLELSRQGELQAMVEALVDAGVPCLLMKGAAVAYSLYADPWLRSRNDNDLLIRGEDVRRADRVLTGLGYVPGNVLVGEVVSHQTPYIKLDTLAVRHVVDLHWRINNRPILADLFTFDELWDRAIPVAALGTAARVPDDQHALLLSCVHPVAHHRNRENLLWIHDTHLLASRIGREGLAELVDAARSKRIARIAAHSLASANRYFHTGIPDDVLEDLRAAAGEPAARYLQRGPWRGDVRLSDFASLSDWRARVQLVREVVLPRTDYMLNEYGSRSRLLVPALHLHRLTRGTWRLLRRFGQ